MAGVLDFDGVQLPVVASCLPCLLSITLSFALILIGVVD